MEEVRRTDVIPLHANQRMYSGSDAHCIHSSGNTVNEVIYHGLKHLVIPQWADTYDWAA
jgi:hypothetical protein